MSARIEFADGTMLDLGHVAADVTLPPWLADRADDLARMLAAVRDAVVTARELDAHRARILGDIPGIRVGGGGYANLAGPLGGGSGGAAGGDAQHQVPVPSTSDEVVEVTVHLDGPDKLESPAAALSVLRCERCGKEFPTTRHRGQHRRFCPAKPTEPVAEPQPEPADAVRACRMCGCTDEDCSGCIERTGEPCSWVEADLCSACFPPDPPATVFEQPIPSNTASATPPPAAPTVVVHPTVAVCDCGHTQRRHEDGDGYCKVGSCDCAGYEAAA